MNTGSSQNVNAVWNHGNFRDWVFEARIFPRSIWASFFDNFHGPQGGLGRGQIHAPLQHTLLTTSCVLT